MIRPRLAALVVTAAVACGGRAVLPPFGPDDGGPDGGSDGGGDGGAGECPPCIGIDADGDGSLAPPCGDDCDDHDSSRYGTAADPLGDGIDQSCDGVDGLDRDRDGHLALSSGGDDCDDTDAGSRPGANDGEGWRVDEMIWAPREWMRLVGSGLAITMDMAGHTHATAAVPSRECNGVTQKNGEPPEEFGGSGPAYATDRGGVLVAEQDIDDSELGCVASRMSLAAGPDGRVHLGYTTKPGRYSLGFQTVYGVLTGAGWQFEAIDSGSGSGTPVAVNRCGEVSLAYATTNSAMTDPNCEIRFATRDHVDWVSEAVEHVCASELALGRGVDGTWWVAYGTITSDEIAEIHVAHGGPAGWQIDVIDSVDGLLASPVAIAVVGDTPHLLYGLSGLRYAVLGRDGWQIEPFPGYYTFVGNDSFEPLSLLSDSSGGIHASYVDRTFAEDGTELHRIMYAVLRDGQWTHTVLGEYPWLFRGDLPELALRADGRPTVLFVEGRTTFLATSSEPGDGIDQNCDGVDGTDADGDGRASRNTGGDDPDDDDPGQ